MQRTSLRIHIEAAQETGLPLIIHSRDADQDMARILAEGYLVKPYTCVMHCFSSGEALAEAALEATRAWNVLAKRLNRAGERRKAGAYQRSAAELPALARAVAALPQLRLRGLMAIPEAQTDAAKQHLPFAQLRLLYEQLQQDGLPLDTLSMGMSGDLAAAIAEGTTIVRIGSAIFGQRSRKEAA